MFIKNSLLVRVEKNMITNKKKNLIFMCVLTFLLLFSTLEAYALVSDNVILGANVLSAPCSENSVRKVLKIFGFILLVAKFAVPLIIIGYATKDLYKSVIDKDEKSLTKQLKQIGIRIFTGICVFFVPSFVYAIFQLSDKLNIVDTAQYQACAACVFEPTNTSKCVVTR